MAEHTKTVWKRQSAIDHQIHTFSWLCMVHIYSANIPFCWWCSLQIPSCYCWFFLSTTVGHLPGLINRSLFQPRGRRGSISVDPRPWRKASDPQLDPPLEGRYVRFFPVPDYPDLCMSYPWRIHGAGIYTNIGGILVVNVTIYSIHGSYVLCIDFVYHMFAMLRIAAWETKGIRSKNAYQVTSTRGAQTLRKSNVPRRW